VADASWNVLVVNNASTDDTAEVLRSARASYSLRSVVEPNAGLAYARNRAIEECQQSELILFTDDDVLVEPDWLSEFLGAARRHPDAVGFGGRIDGWFPVEPDPDLVRAFPALARGFCGLDRGPDERVLGDEDVTGANMGFRTAAIADLRFRTDLGVKGAQTVGGDELDFQNRIRSRGGSLVWVPTMRVRHYVDPARMTLPYLLKFAEDAGRREVRLHGIPHGPRFAGVPRWLVRRALEHGGAALRHRFAGRRAAALSETRQRNEFAGMAKECWTLSRRGDSRGPG
jgi:glycosyltransferase involved in cell wall biosynthesis